VRRDSLEELGEFLTGEVRGIAGARYRRERMFGSGKGSSYLIRLCERGSALRPHSGVLALFQGNGRCELTCDRLRHPLVGEILGLGPYWGLTGGSDESGDEGGGTVSQPRHHENSKNRNTKRYSKNLNLLPYATVTAEVWYEPATTYATVSIGDPTFSNDWVVPFIRL